MVWILPFALTAVAAYLIGSIPTGYLVARGKGIDIRALGSGNIGATNVSRVVGRGAGVFVLTVDVLKGFTACWLLARLAAGWFGLAGDPASAERECLAITAGMAGILGHNFTCWLRFRGGKGIATSAGVLLALLPKALVLVALVWLAVFAASRFVSLASVAAAFCLPFATWLTGQSGRLIVLAALMGVLAIYKHKANIQRLLNGTEHRFGTRTTPAPNPPAV